MRYPLLASVLLICFQPGFSQSPLFQLAPIFGSNMVLQQKSTVPVWGRGVPGSHIAVHASWGRDAQATVRADGSWDLAIKTPAAGGPYLVIIRHDNASDTLANVLAGEVWLCSGQSNMEMPLTGWPSDSILNSADEIKNSAYPNIRLFTVKRAFAATPESSCSGTWVECSPQTSGSFSAAGYFFGRDLHRALRIPIGLVHSSWGGTPIEAWMSAETLTGVPGFDTTLQKIRVTADSLKILDAWLNQFPVIKVGERKRETRWQQLDLQDKDCPLPGYDDRAWRVMQLPTYWERTSLGEFDGAVWFRRTATIPATWKHRDLLLELGPIDDIDETFVNGMKVGGCETEGMWNIDRVYPVPANLVDSTVLQIAVRVIDYGGGGGIYGAAKSMFIHPRGEEGVPLAGDWRYLPVADYRGDELYVFGPKGEKYFSRPSLPMPFSAYTATSLFNGMIAPLTPFSFAGAIWYQGESNTGEPELYTKLFPLMIQNWRTSFRTRGLPFYFVQIAPWAYGPGTESEFLREAQCKTLSVPGTGMAVTLDIGNNNTIHPCNKEEVGRRLALWALAINYHKDGEFSGPILRSVRKLKDRIELTFDHAGSGLVLTGGTFGDGFEIAGADRVFRYADVRVEGKKLVVYNGEVKDPQAVRYAFTNTAKATLFNTAGLPASSFRTDDWPR